MSLAWQIEELACRATGKTEKETEDEDYKRVYDKYGNTHEIEKVDGTVARIMDLDDDQEVCWGDGKTYHFLLTKKRSKCSL